MEAPGLVPSPKSSTVGSSSESVARNQAPVLPSHLTNTLRADSILSYSFGHNSYDVIDESCYSYSPTCAGGEFERRSGGRTSNSFSCRLLCGSFCSIFFARGSLENTDAPG